MTDATLSQPKPGIPNLTPDELETPPLTLTQLTWRRFRRHRMAIFGTITLLLILLYALIGSFVFTEGYSNRTETGNALQSPSREHPFGTDTIGRDILARTIYGGQISILIGLTAMLVEVILGVSIGAMAGYFGGWLDSALMRVTEAILVIPQIFLLLVMARYFAASIPNIKFAGRTFSGSVIVIVFVIGITSWPYLARLVRAQFLSVKENDYILAARATGTSTKDIILRHVLPNSIAPIIVSATLSIAAAIILEAYISFLGLGVQPPTATWGNMLEGAYNYIESAWWLWFFPGMFIVLIVLSINFLGDGLRDALDPHSRAV
ncbi:MAG: ABC transporter permease [Anaerolineales bacterium]|nr:MAG: ABC transporter permease [Anaerolineales bacterium]